MSEFGPCPEGDACRTANCDGTDLGHELAEDFPAETARVAAAEEAWKRSLPDGSMGSGSRKASPQE